MPTEAPEQEPDNHLHNSPLPKVPPVKLSEVGEPLQIYDGFEEADVAGIEFVHIVTTLLTQLVVLHGPSALT